MKGKKTVLIFTDWYLPGYKAGGPITSLANMIRNLSNYFNFKIVCRDTDYTDADPFDNVVSDEWNKVGEAQVRYLSTNNLNYSRISGLIKETNPDVVYVTGFFSKVFSIFPVLAARKYRVILSPRGMLAEGALGIKTSKKKLFLAIAGRVSAYKKIFWHATNEAEAEQVLAFFPKAKVGVAPNFPGISTAKTELKKPKIKGELRLYSVARVAPEKNLDFALNCLKQIPSTVRVSLKIIGSIYDRAYFQKLESIKHQLNDSVSVDFLGPIPQKEIGEIAKESDFFFLPTLGENYGHAIIEAMLMGIPVLISNKTPWTSLDVKSLGFDLPLVEDLFAKRIIDLANMGADEYQSKYSNVNQKAEKLIDFQNISQAYLALFNDSNRSE